jgi:hypothetical protein
LIQRVDGLAGSCGIAAYPHTAGSMPLRLDHSLQTIKCTFCACQMFLQCTKCAKDLIQRVDGLAGSCGIAAYPHTRMVKSGMAKPQNRLVTELVDPCPALPAGLGYPHTPVTPTFLSGELADGMTLGLLRCRSFGDFPRSPADLISGRPVERHIIIRISR